MRFGQRTGLVVEKSGKVGIHYYLSTHGHSTIKKREGEREARRTKKDHTRTSGCATPKYSHTLQSMRTQAAIHTLSIDIPYREHLAAYSRAFPYA